MKKLALIFMSFAVIACTTGPRITTDYDPEYSFGGITSYYLVIKNRDKINDINAARVDNAIKRSMDARGIKAVAQDQAQVLVDYLIVTQDKTKVRSYNSSHGYSCYRCWGMHQANQVEVSNYVEGSLMIDLLSPKTNKTIWRGMGSKSINPKRTPEEKTVIINEYTDAIIAEMPLF